MYPYSFAFGMLFDIHSESTLSSRSNINSYNMFNLCYVVFSLLYLPLILQLLCFFQMLSLNNEKANLKPFMTHPQSPTYGCNRRSLCTTNICLNGGTCVDNWITSSCKCANGFQGATCDEQVTASFTTNVMGMKFESPSNIENVTFKFLVSSAWDGLILSTDNQVSSHLLSISLHCTLMLVVFPLRR